MPLTFAAITPHSPLLIPGIGKENLEKLDQTVKALQTLEKEIYATLPDVVVVISPHGTLYEDTFTVNIGSSQNINIHEGNFEEFGEYSTKVKYTSDPELATKIIEHVEKEMSVKLVNNENLDNGVSVPLFYLTSHLPGIAVVPVGFSLERPTKQVMFGKLLKDVFDQYDKRVAVIASAELSHALTKQSPAGFHKSGKLFDSSVIELLSNNQLDDLVNLDQDFVSEAETCGYRSLLVLAGILSGMNYTYHRLSYEAPFGVGYLTGHFELRY